MSANPPKKCPKCGAELVADPRFCHVCGQSVVAPVEVRGGAAMAKKTMLGMPAYSAVGAKGLDQQGPTADAASAQREAAQTGPGTIAGVPAPGQAARPMPPPPAGAAPAPAGPRTQKTMLGLPAAMPQAGGATGKPVDPVPPQAEDPLAYASTELELHSPVSPPSARARVQAQPERTAQPSERAQPSDQAQPSEPGGGSRPAVARPAAPSAMQGADDAYEVKTRRGKSGGRAALLLVLAVAGGLAAWWFVGRSPTQLQVSLSQHNGQEQLHVTVTNAAPGTRVRLDGQERELKGGRASFEAGLDTLRVGDNALKLDVTTAAGETRTHSHTLTVPHRVLVQLAPLASEQPALEVMVQARMGTKVSVAGKPLQLDSRGQVAYRHPVEATETGDQEVQVNIPYELLLPDGSSVRGKVSRTIPRVSLEIERPDSEVWTDASHVMVVGSVGSATQVRVHDKPAQVRDGRFSLNYPLPQRGDYTLVVVARSSEAAPRHKTLKVHRVRDLRASAARYAADAKLGYAMLSKDPEGHRGEKVAFEGLVYNVDSREGTSLQIHVGTCPVKGGCPLWVSYWSAKAIAPRSWVRVAGLASGVQPVRSDTAGLQSVPSVRAAFVFVSARRSAASRRGGAKSKRPRRRREHTPASGPVMPE
ncbi:MAG: hypothetical protein MJD61_10435 [Proteobacteria bacterium]|nr:hypothetical protein [Pseudomonadota bacterium]